MQIPKGSLVCFLDERDSPDSMIVGGYYIPKKDLEAIDDHMIKVKHKFNLTESDPIKWNLKDNACLNARKLIRDKKVDDLRLRVFSIIEKIPVIIIMSQVWKGKPENLEDAWKWAFIDILQRLSIDIERKQAELKSLDYYPFLDIVFDWFPGGDKLDNYFNVYQQAYFNGYSFEGNELKPFHDFKACPCLLITSARYSHALQLADFFLGATTDFFTWCYKGYRKQSVEKFFSYFYKTFRTGDKNEVLGCGLITKKESREKILYKLMELGLEKNEKQKEKVIEL